MMGQHYPQDSAKSPFMNPDRCKPEKTVIACKPRLLNPAAPGNKLITNVRFRPIADIHGTCKLRLCLIGLARRLEP